MARSFSDEASEEIVRADVPFEEYFVAACLPNLGSKDARRKQCRANIFPPPVRDNRLHSIVRLGEGVCPSVESAKSFDYGDHLKFHLPDWEISFS